MQQFFTTIFAVLKSIIDMLFELPFIGSVSYGHMLIAIYLIALLLFIIVGRLK